jgi:ankyrin repeat protein
VAAKWGKSNMVTLLLDKGANLESKTRDGLTPLHCAARSGHENVVDVMIQRGAPISSKTKNGLAPLHMSSQGDHVDAARILLHHKVGFFLDFFVVKAGSYVLSKAPMKTFADDKCRHKILFKKSVRESAPEADTFFLYVYPTGRAV